MYFQDVILTLQKFWAEQGCIIVQPYDMEVGAGTSSPMTLLRCIDAKPWNVAYVQPSRRPADGRYAENPNRMQHYYQFQVILKPSPDNIQELCLNSLQSLGLNPKYHDIRFIEDDWENPTLGAWGLGWEVWCDGMEVFQFTYMQQVGGIPCRIIPGELTYGLERITMFLQGVESVWDIRWNAQGVTYRDVFMQAEKEYCAYNFEHADTEMLFNAFAAHINEFQKLLDHRLLHPAYDQVLKAAHVFNLLDARGVISVTERASHIAKIREMSKAACMLVMSS